MARQGMMAASLRTGRTRTNKQVSRRWTDRRPHHCKMPGRLVDRFGASFAFSFQIDQEWNSGTLSNTILFHNDANPDSESTTEVGPTVPADIHTTTTTTKTTTKTTTNLIFVLKYMQKHREIQRLHYGSVRWLRDDDFNQKNKRLHYSYHHHHRCCVVVFTPRLHHRILPCGR
jgi:hypothetical protein